ncbi:MAG: polysaccharide deacetylase family protein [Janthinobacterium lividum]
MSTLLEAGGALAAGGLLVGGYCYASMWPTSQLFGTTLIAGPDTVPHTIALTYDDGPSTRNTPPLLDLLAEFQVRATFFMIGEHVRKHPELARRVVAAGHVIGNHTSMHPNLARKSSSRVRQELTTCQKTMEDLLGVSPVLFRPPYGARRPDVLRTARSLGLTPTLWNVTAQDWLDIGADAILANVDKASTQNQRKGDASNLLLHDGSHLDTAEPVSRADTLAVTRTLLDRGTYRFTTPLEWMAANAIAPSL